MTIESDKHHLLEDEECPTQHSVGRAAPVEVEDQNVASLGFDETFVRPKGMVGAGCYMELSRYLYTFFLNVTYMAFSLTIGLILAVVFGFVLGLLSFVHTYVLMPVLKMVVIVMESTVKGYQYMVRSFCDPVAESYSLLFKNINIGYFDKTKPAVMTV
eukprot:CAMPEP_0119147806 /NCGR_PEP_ID=MMETSP1310-20130426/40903_1 /TAXON_ID=464262 /ORGANISM="Genus nov. species nov., Strain RCC2339" /LENGTH=157 /DNA_ID=CAMNT_0007139799 /DNA_START=80 /DNA_END=553 /DNA_ORIENTATION=+